MCIIGLGFIWLLLAYTFAKKDFNAMGTYREVDIGEFVKWYREFHKESK
jgi:UDP-N-acetyl-D-mannosaminuronate dehydrogenase